MDDAYIYKCVANEGGPKLTDQDPGLWCGRKILILALGL